MGNDLYTLLFIRYTLFLSLFFNFLINTMLLLQGEERNNFAIDKCQNMYIEATQFIFVSCYFVIY